MLGVDQRSDAGWGFSETTSGIPAGSALITGVLYLSFNRKSNCSQWFSSADLRRKMSRPLNGYENLNKNGLSRAVTPKSPLPIKNS